MNLIEYLIKIKNIEYYFIYKHEILKDFNYIELLQ